MEDLDTALVAAIVRGGAVALKTARDKGLRPEFLRGDGLRLYEFVIAYSAQYGGGPPPLEVVLGSLGAPLPEPMPGVPVEFLVDAVRDRKTYEYVFKGYKELENLLVAKPPSAAGLVKHLEQMILELRREKLTAAPVESLFALGPKVRERYERLKAGERGILTPWNAVNDATLGFWPMDLVLFVARIAIGKTWLAVILAYEAWKQGKRILFASTEMSRERVATRLFALIYRLPYREFTAGRLTMHSEPRFYEGVDAMLNEQGLYVVGGDFDFRVETLSAAVDEVDPDLLILDGAYLLRTSGQTRTERAANAFDELKRLANRHSMVLAATHQLNREAKVNVAASVSAESISLTDVAGWNADLIFGLIQTNDMRVDKKLRLKPLKVREGVGYEVEVRWDLDAMDFSELGRVNGPSGASGDAAEYDSGVSDTPPTDDVPF